MSRRRERRARISAGESAFARAAASSTASGRASRRRQSSVTASDGSSCARSQNSETASASARGGTWYSLSPCTRRSSLLVTSRVRCGQRARSGESSGAASITCSRLSSRSSISRSPMCSARLSFAPSVCPIVSVTSAGSRRDASPTQKTPALYSGTSDAAASRPSRVLPEPPGPVRVTSRAPSSMRSSTSCSSRSLPTKELAGRGRFVFEIVLSGGNCPWPSWKIASGSGMSLSRCSPSSTSG
jgi:hypothetical protein